MHRRPPLFVLLLVLLTGVGLPVQGVVAPSATAGASAAEEACPTSPVSTPGGPVALSAEGGGTRATECWSLTPGRTGAHAFQLSYDGRWYARLVVRGPAGEVVADKRWAYGEPVPVARLEAGTAYRVEVGPVQQFPPVAPAYRLAVFDLGSGCQTLPQPRWSVAPVTFDLSGDRVGCGSLTTTSPSPLRIEAQQSGWRATLAVVDERGAEVCKERVVVDGPVTVCPTLPAGTYRVVVGVREHSETTVELAAVPVDTAADCRPMLLGGYAEPLPVAGRRAADGRGQECFEITAPSSGPYDFRGWQVEEDWIEKYEIWDATAGELLYLAPDHYRLPEPQPVRVDLVAEHDYRVLVWGRPFAGSPVTTYDPEYRLGLLDRTSTDGCLPLETGWLDPAASGRVEAGSINCHLLDAPPGTWARLDFRPTDTAPVTPLWQRVVDAEGDEAAADGLTCHQGGDPGRGAEPWRCPLAGPGPYRILTNSGPAVAEADYTLAVNLPSDGQGCEPLPVATWGAEVPATGVRAAEGAGADCWTATVTDAGSYVLTMAKHSGTWRYGHLEVYDADGRLVVRDIAPFSHDDVRVDLPAGTYRIVASGDPGSAPSRYSLGLYDVDGNASDGAAPATACPTLPSASLAADPVQGTTARGNRDCFRLPGSASGGVIVRLDSTADGESGTWATLFDGAGLAVCLVGAGPSRRCELTGPGPHRVVVGDHAGPAGAAYRLQVLDPDARAGCRTARTTEPGADPVDFALTADGAHGCVALPNDAEQLLWAVEGDGVETVLLDGDAEPVCASSLREAPSQVCDLTEHPVPYSLLLSNADDVHRDARALLRVDPAAEPGCASSRMTPDGPEPLAGSTAGSLDLTCHDVSFARHDQFALDRFHLAGGVPPDVHAFKPNGEFLCSGQGVGAPQYRPLCGAEEMPGRHVFVVVGGSDSAGPYRVDLACPQAGCARSAPVTLRRGALRGPIRVGRALAAAGVSGTPPDATVSWRWLVDGTVVSRARTYTPRPADRGRRVQLTAVVTADGHPRMVLRSAVRVVLAGRVVLRHSDRILGDARIGGVLRTAQPRVTVPSRGTRVSFRWMRDGEPVPGAGGRTYRVRPADRGHRLRVRVTVRADGYATAKVVSGSRRVG